MKKTIFLIALLVFIGCSKDFQDYCDCIEDYDYVQSEKFITPQIEIGGIFGLEDWLISQPCIFDARKNIGTESIATYFIYFNNDVKKILLISNEGKLIISYVAYKE